MPRSGATPIDPGGSGDNKAAGGTPRSEVLVGDVLGGKGCIQVTLSVHRSRRETRNRAWVRRIAGRGGVPRARRLHGTLVAGQESALEFVSTPGLSFPVRKGVQFRGCGGYRAGPAAGCGVWWPRVPSVAGRGGRARDRGPACAGRVASPGGALAWPGASQTRPGSSQTVAPQRHHCAARGLSGGAPHLAPANLADGPTMRPGCLGDERMDQCHGL